MSKSRRRHKPSANLTNPRPPHPDDAPPKTIIARFARGLVVVEYVMLVGMGIAMLLGLLSASIDSSGGATRSSQVKLAERQSEIEQALRERESAYTSLNHTADEPGGPPISSHHSDLR